MCRRGVAAPPPTWRFGLLQAQVPELIGDEVQVAEGDLLARLYLLHVIAELEDEAYLKHNESILKGPYLACQLSKELASAIPSSVFTYRESDG